MFKKIIIIASLFLIMSCSYTIYELEESITLNDYNTSIKILNKNPELVNDNKDILKKAIRQQKAQKDKNNIVIEKVLSISTNNYLEETDYLYLLKSENFYLMEMIFKSGINPLDVIIRKRSLPYYLLDYDTKSFELLFVNKHIDISKSDELFINIIRDNNFNAVKFLIESGANCNSEITLKDGSIKSPFIQSLTTGNKHITNLIMENIKDYTSLKNIWEHLGWQEKNADLDFANKLWELGVRDNYSLTQALFNAAGDRDKKYLVWLLEKGADPYITTYFMDEEYAPDDLADYIVKMEMEVDSDERQKMYDEAYEISQIMNKYRENGRIVNKSNFDFILGNFESSNTRFPINNIFIEITKNYDDFILNLYNIQNKHKVLIDRFDFYYDDLEITSNGYVVVSRKTSLTQDYDLKLNREDELLKISYELKINHESADKNLLNMKLKFGNIDLLMNDIDINKSSIDYSIASTKTWPNENEENLNLILFSTNESSDVQIRYTKDKLIFNEESLDSEAFIIDNLLIIETSDLRINILRYNELILGTFRNAKNENMYKSIIHN